MKKNLRKAIPVLLSLTLVLGTVAVSSATEYVVKEGDYLSTIAPMYNTTWEKLAELNNLTDPNLIYTGQTLKVSGTVPTTVAPGTSTPEVITPVTVTPEVITPAEPAKNFSDEMKIPYAVDQSPPDGADSVERMGDHIDSPYFKSPDFYNMESTDTLTIIPKFKTIQQTTEWACGITSMVMVLDYYDKLGDYTEESLSAMRSNGTNPGATSLIDMVTIFESLGIETDSTYDYPGDAIYEYMTLDKIQELLAEGKPILIAWNDWGGHWQVIVGYDNMGTETYQDDVMIVADPYDTTDHNQDGYGIYPAERFYYNWTMYDFFESWELEERDMLFCTIDVM